MTLQYIRDFYKVPAKRGGRIRYTTGWGEVWNGVILGARGAHLSVRFDGERRRHILHPQWEVEYMETAGSASDV